MITRPLLLARRFKPSRRRHLGRMRAPRFFHADGFHSRTPAHLLSCRQAETGRCALNLSPGANVTFFMERRRSGMAAYPLIGVSGSIDAEETRHFILQGLSDGGNRSGRGARAAQPGHGGRYAGGLPCAPGRSAYWRAATMCPPPSSASRPWRRWARSIPCATVLKCAWCAWLRARRMPVLGICRGVQAMAAALGGSLWQDLPSQYRTADGNPPIAHRQTSPGRYASHTVAVLPGTLLARLTRRRGNADASIPSIIRR